MEPGTSTLAGQAVLCDKARVTLSAGIAGFSSAERLFLAFTTWVITPTMATNPNTIRIIIT